MKWNTKLWKIWNIVCTSFMIGVAVCCCVVSGQVNLNQLYENGAVYEFFVGQGCYVDAPDGYMQFEEFDGEVSWRKVRFEISEWSGTTDVFTLYCVNEQEQVIYNADVLLQDGENEIVLPEDILPYSRLSFVSKDKSPYTMYMVNMAFYENSMGLPWRRGMAAGGVCAIFFAFVYGKLIWNRKRGISDWALSMIEKYDSVAMNILPKREMKHVSTIRIMALMLLYTIMLVMEAVGDYGNDGYNYLMIISAGIILLIARLSFHQGEKIAPPSFGKEMIPWVWMWLVACASDVIIYKNFHYTGWFMFLVMSLLFYAWKSMENPRELLEDIRKSLVIYYIPVVIFCVLFRPLMEGVRYPGVCINPITFGIYLSVTMLAYMSLLMEDLQNRFQKRDVGCIIACVSALYFTWESQSIGPLAVIALTGLFYVYHLLKIRVDLKRLSLAVVCALVLSLPTVGILKVAISTVPYVLKTQIVFDKDFYLSKESLEDVSADEFLTAILPESKVLAEGMEVTSEETGSRITNKLSHLTNIDYFTSGRTLYQRVHLRLINIWGHESSPFFYERTHQPHNGLVAMLYRYGIFMVAPYVLFLVVYILKTWRIMKTDEKDGLHWFLFTMTWSVLALTMYDNVEQPFRWISWVIFYVCFGYPATEKIKGGTE